MSVETRYPDRKARKSRSGSRSSSININISFLVNTSIYAQRTGGVLFAYSCLPQLPCSLHLSDGA
jgi:hypothetical protein